MKYLLALCCLFTVTFCVAQKPKVQQVFYFKNDGSKLPAIDSADFVRVVSLPDSGSTLFGIVDYYRNNKPKLMGKSSSIDPAVFEEQCVTYLPNGKRQAVLTYTGGVLTGTNYLFHPNGKLYLTFTMDTVRNRSFDENMNVVTCMDSTGKALATEGNGHFVSYNEATHAIIEEGDIKNGKRVGEWHGSYPTEKVTYTDTYTDGKFISGYCTTGTGVKYTYTAKSQTPAFTGGNTAFINLIKKKLKLPAALKNKPVSIFASFSVKNNGKVADATLLGSISPEVDKALITAINSSPAWTPRLQNGLPLDSSWGIPITFNTPAAKPATPAAKAKN